MKPEGEEGISGRRRHLGTQFKAARNSSILFFYSKLLKKVHTRVYIRYKLLMQVVTDNASYNIAAGRMLMKKRKKLFWTPCAAHCLDLMLEDIGKLKEYAGAIAKAKKLTAYVYTHTHLLDHMRKETKGKELVRFGVTRFATAFLTLERLNDEIVKFWHAVKEILRACQPILQVLRIVDGDEKPAMGYLYAAMELARNQIMKNFGMKQSKYQPILKIVDKRWKDQMNRPLHEAGFFFKSQALF
ncbi:hypothetical protein Taro_017169 [Colocasia esculenta]|uniref:DUF659 domain-containing protein n=1 Tax=Colocasia esculenta TaxID=4460 RepID=A0A843UMU5_COLES|nr:hypothetical protein [Colocasia esculenta]